MNIQQTRFEQSVMLQKWLTYSSFDDRNMYMCVVVCPHCKEAHRVSFGGWSALKCTSCQGHFGRPGVKS